ncbi:MAG: thiosulfate/3-mercaptopyruvate sulfurtransferase [Betaproteobacteria bacterium]|jgi:thiosulfate/3-mercaptopyruvate sulfurtransferase|nr:thiosulfate/3-mercaptopyruvate sulfurtransferase [Betaproteobacteria bacterium]
MSKPLVSTEELATHLAAWRVFDCRHDLMKPDLGEQQYREAHIPGALFAHMERDLSAPKNGKNGRHPLPDPAAFAAWLGKKGLKKDDQVVCYDAVNGSTAARMWWMLRWLGHEKVAVLDGGIAKWTKEGRPVTAEVRSFPSMSYAARPRPDVLTAETVNRDLKKLFLLDARAPGRWRGEQEPIDPVAGRIPGARNRFNADNVQADGTFKPVDRLKGELQAVLKGHKPANVVHYCGSGVSACHNLLAMEIAGLTGGKLYPGSWSEWIADPSRPQEKG